MNSSLVVARYQLFDLFKILRKDFRPFQTYFDFFFHISALSSVDQYIYAHDTLAAAIECGHLHGVIQLRNGTLTHNGATHATSVDRMSEFSAHAV